METNFKEILKKGHIRSTKQRIRLLEILFSQSPCHISAEQLYTECQSTGLNLSLATVYNTLKKLKSQGFLKEVVVSSSRAYFDTNTTHHYHLYYEKNGVLSDIPQNSFSLAFKTKELSFLKNLPTYQTEIIIRVP